jgi:hypothetical protein
MVLSHIAEKLGIWDILAPLTNSINNNNPNNNENNPENDQTRRKRKQATKDEQLAQRLQKEENIRYNKIKTQFENEKRVEKLNQFAKKQRVLYHSKIDDKLIDAVVVGVHFDDGPDRPYYVSLMDVYCI